MRGLRSRTTRTHAMVVDLFQVVKDRNAMLKITLFVCVVLQTHIKCVNLHRCYNSDNANIIISI